jgi:3-oxoacyl-[acyl-carrier-protein] synthase III
MSEWLMLERSPDGAAAPFVARLASVGRRLPEATLTTDELMASTRHHTHIDLERLTGIRQRRISAGEEDSYTLAVAAAEDCLSRSDIRAEELDILISCSITTYRDGLIQRLEPPMSMAVAQAIGATNARTFDLTNACAGTLTGLFVVNNWIRRGQARRGLVVSGEFISQLTRNAARHVRSILSKELASLTLGDAGAAALLERAPGGVAGISVAAFTTVADHSRMCLAWPAAHDPGGRMFTDSRGIQRAAIADSPFLIREALDAVGLDLGEIDYLIPHQTSVRAIRKGTASFEAALGVEQRHPAVVTVDRFGNTASTTHIVALAEELRAGRLQPGDRVVLLALASGLEIGVVLLTVDDRLVGSNGNHD